MPTELRPSPDCPVPAVVRVPPHHSVLRYGAAGRLLGLDPERALAVDPLPAGLADMLDELVEPVPVAALLARAVQRGASPERAERLLTDLLRAGAVVDAAPEAHRVRQRAESCVVVSGAGPLTVGLVLGLVRAGVGQVHTDGATGMVRAGDLGTGHLDADRGRERAAAIREAVRRMQPDADAPAAPARLVGDLVVLADALAPDPVLLARLHARGQAHLPVRMRDGVGLVGPLVHPGRTACLGCLELARAARAPNWPTVTAQLTGRPGRADPAATAAAAALGVAQAVAALDSTSGGARPPTWETTLEVDAAAGTIARRRWRPEPDCGCGAAPVAAAAGGPGHDRVASAKADQRETIMV